MILHLCPDEPTPPYEQLRAQIATMIRTGALPVDERLPSIRQLAADLGLAPGTVGRAYTELERDGLVQSRRGRHGTYVLNAPRPPTPDERDRKLAEAAQHFAVHARQLGVGARDALQQVRQALTALPDEPVREA